MNSYDPISYCSNNPLFREVNKDGIKQIAGQMRSIEVKKGNIIYFQGDRPASVYFIRTGSVKLSRITPEGRELTFSILGKNDIFGVTSVLLGNQRPTAAEAVVDCLLYQMYRSQFLQMLKRFPSLAIYLSSTIGQRLIKLEEKLQIAVSRDVASRISSTLLDLADQFGKASKEGVIIDIPLTHLEIAGLIGSTRETTCMTLNKFRRRGWIQTERRAITLIDLKALRSLCET